MAADTFPRPLPATVMNGAAAVTNAGDTAVTAGGVGGGVGGGPADPFTHVYTGARVVLAPQPVFT
jgi:hypothetical protein